MQMTFDTNNLSALDQHLLLALLNDPEKIGAPAPEPKPDARKGGRPRKAAAPTVEVEVDPENSAVEPEPTGATMEQAIAAATALLAEGKTDLVKDALAAAGATRVSNLTDVDTFMAALA
jgi:hypothetical protein